MGRKKRQITLIEDEKKRRVTFAGRSFGLIKKAYELSVLCNCEIALIVFNDSNEHFHYASTDLDKILLKFAEYNKPHKSWSNSDVIQELNKEKNKNKKKQHACKSPDVADSTTDALTPNTEAKDKKINDEFEHMIKSHEMPSLPPPTLPHPGGGGASDGRTTATDNQPRKKAHGTPDAATRFVESPLKIAPPRSSARKSDPRAHTSTSEAAKATPELNKEKNKNKKKQHACKSPDVADSTTDALTPNTKAKDKKINDEFEHMIKSHEMPSLPPPTLPHPGGGGASDGRTTATDNQPRKKAHGTPDAATRFVESPLKIAPPRSSARKSDPRAHTSTSEAAKATPEPNKEKNKKKNKKKRHPCKSPDVADSTTDALTPNTEAKYKKINDEFAHGTPDAGDMPSNWELILQNGSGTDATRFVEYPPMIAPPRWSDPRAHASASEAPDEQSYPSSVFWITPMVPMSTPGLTLYSLLFGDAYEICRAEMLNMTPPIGPFFNSMNPWQQQMSSTMGAGVSNISIMGNLDRPNFLPPTIARPEPGDNTPTNCLGDKSLGDSDEWSPPRK
ncbi:uncharacterized protein LOC144092084 [Stigmatopora argus]